MSEQLRVGDRLDVTFTYREGGRWEAAMNKTHYFGFGDTVVEAFEDLMTMAVADTVRRIVAREAGDDRSR